MAAHQHVETWLWIQYLDAHLTRLSGHLSSFPRLRGLRAASFFDPRSTAVLVRLRFAGGMRASAALRSWVARAGLELIDAQAWSAQRRSEFSSAVARYRCKGDETSTARAIVGFVAQLMRASRRNEADAIAMPPAPPIPLEGGGTSDGVPKSVEIRDSFKVELMKHPGASRILDLRRR